MSYDHNAYVGTYVKCTLKPGAKWLHFLMSETDDAEVRHVTKDRAGVEDIAKLKGMHYVFPECMPDNKKFAYIMLPGYKSLDDVGRSDGDVLEMNPAQLQLEPEMVDILKKVFDFSKITVHFGAVVEVV